ncbi:MAG: RNA polymerase sigma factor [Actinobacteria bacterium]|nr:RNA polymerase sigma factor [Actinomycetota bacterium]
MTEALMRRIREGDEAAFTELYGHYADHALRIAMAVTKDKDSAADAVQEAFVRVYHHVDSFDLDKPFKPWFYRILINECNRILKSRSRIVFIQDFIERISGMRQSYDHNFEEYEALYSAVKQLKDTHRIPIVLKYLEDFQESEIAEILGLNLNTVKTRLFKGRQKLKKAIERLEKRGEMYDEQISRS